MRKVFILFLCLLHCLSLPNACADKNEAEILFEAFKIWIKGGGRIGMHGPSTSTNQMLEASQMQSVGTSSRILRQSGSKETDKISYLPGQPNGINFNQYAGYITVDQVAGRALFYYFAEAVPSNNTSSSPLVLWLNGGPGCSSVGMGAMTELGPFRVLNDGKTLYRNPYAWNEVANVLFLESPAGVGFSYSNTSKDYETFGDMKVAEDSYAFLLNWLERFPEYKGREFHIIGESYAGHYVPQLAQTILRYNRFSNDASTRINLKGIMIGNPALNFIPDNQAMIDYLWSHAIISDEIRETLNKCYFLIQTNYTQTPPPECDKADTYVTNIKNIFDGYNIYAPRCYNPGINPMVTRQRTKHVDPCINYYVDAYLNNVEVQKSIHANVTRLKDPWSRCNQNILTNWLMQLQPYRETVLAIFPELINNSVRVMLYSGDLDSVVPFTATKYSVNQLKLSVSREWTPWAVGKELAGFNIMYKGNVTYATVRGAGHFVPSDQPERALVLVKHFLEGEPLPAMKIPDLFKS